MRNEPDNPFQVQLPDLRPVASGQNERPISVCPKCQKRNVRFDVIGSYVFGVPFRCKGCREHFRIIRKCPESIKDIVICEMLSAGLTIFFILALLAISRSTSVICVFFVSWTISPFFSVLFQYRRDVSKQGVRRVRFAQGPFQGMIASVQYLICQAARGYFCVAIGFHAWGINEAHYWISPILQGQVQGMLVYLAFPLAVGFALQCGFASTSRLSFGSGRRRERVVFSWLCVAAIAFIAEVEVLPPFMAVFGPPGSNHLWCNWWFYFKVNPMPFAERIAWTAGFLILAGLLLWVMSRWSANQAPQE